MEQVSRRDAVKAVVAGAAVSGFASAAVARPSTLAAAPATPPSGLSVGMSPSTQARASAKLAAQRLQRASMPTGGAGARTAWAHVSNVVSWDARVLLTLADGTTGMVALDGPSRALAAACQAAGRPLAVRVWGHDAHVAGVGSFEGAIVALDITDLTASGLDASDIREQPLPVAVQPRALPRQAIS